MTPIQLGCLIHLLVVGFKSGDGNVSVMKTFLSG